MKAYWHIVFILVSVSFAYADEILDTALKATGLQSVDLTIDSTTLDDPDRMKITRQVLEKPDYVDHVVNTLTGQQVDDVFLWGAGLIGVDVVMMTDLQMKTLDSWASELADCQKRLDQLLIAFDADDRIDLKALMGLVDPGVVLKEIRKDKLIALGRRVPVNELVHLGRRVVHIAEGIAKSEHEFKPGRVKTSAGWVVVGTEGDDIYEESAVLIIDPGGNDVYRIVGEQLIMVCIDLSGNDIYQKKKGQGILGIDIVIDQDGDDRYEGEGIGTGIAGVGVVIDRRGDDVYQSKMGGQGFGIYGIGILFDGDGSDQYAGGHLVQGAAGPGGLGILFDVAGKDVYEAGQLYRDFREGGTFFQSMSQGFARGVRPLTSGGVGALVDGKGDDVYRVDYFGQGAAFWGGAGFLIDRGGQDQYHARRYAQGAGVHVSVGALVDLAGDDVYDIWGVGQGCGHDLSVGLLFDHEGADNYQATWLAQGAGSANGIGWLDDRGGDDRYVAKREDTQGYGVLSRDYGSIGLFVDRAGQDTYDGQGATGMLWRGGHYGVGVDWPLRVIKK